jgi:hypothetical protein
MDEGSVISLGRWLLTHDQSLFHFIFSRGINSIGEEDAKKLIALKRAIIEMEDSAPVNRTVRALDNKVTPPVSSACSSSGSRC